MNSIVRRLLQLEQRDMAVLPLITVPLHPALGAAEAAFMDCLAAHDHADAADTEPPPLAIVAAEGAFIAVLRDYWRMEGAGR